MARTKYFFRNERSPLQFEKSRVLLKRRPSIIRVENLKFDAAFVSAASPLVANSRTKSNSALQVASIDPSQGDENASRDIPKITTDISKGDIDHEYRN